jgi:hypothetical protein
MAATSRKAIQVAASAKSMWRTDFQIMMAAFVTDPVIVAGRFATAISRSSRRQVICAWPSSSFAKYDQI